MTVKQIGQRLASLKGQREKVEATRRAAHQKYLDLTRQIKELAEQERAARAREREAGKGKPAKPRVKATAGKGKPDEDE